LDDVTIRTPSRCLLDRARLTLPAGKITLLVGASGTGKSVFLRAVAGLIEPSRTDLRVRGGIFFEDETGSRSGLPAVGVVFQNLALFDELSAEDNIRLGRDHRVDEDRDHSVDDLMDELSIPRGVPTAHLSGGQRQRVAIARVLAQGAPVVLYDEPTSGLDSATAERVANLIGDVQRSHPKTCLIVTHDIESLLPIADHVWMLDGRDGSLGEVSRDDWGRLPAMLAATLPTLSEEPRRPSWWRMLGDAMGRFLSGTGDWALELAVLPARLVPWWRSTRWGIYYAWQFARLVAGPSAWLYIALAGAIVGFVATYFTFRYLPYARYTEPLLLENLLASIGFALYRILIPVFATILIAARSGAAVASDVGGKVYGRQRDVIRTMSARPAGYWFFGVVWAFLLGTPFLVGIAYLAGSLVSVGVFTFLRPDLGPNFWDLHYHHTLRDAGTYFWAGTGWVLAKVGLCGLGTAVIAYRLGDAPKLSPSDVSRSITRTVLVATIFVLLVHFAFAFVEFE
jgi:ABC-type transporter Mla maintaining outer membrane lipid asymmetry ATPase subunit MlaF/ABC-type transporter Mla maintaining outer membrane lipid asymmetry permease subunit MlaE